MSSTIYVRALAGLVFASFAMLADNVSAVTPTFGPTSYFSEADSLSFGRGIPGFQLEDFEDGWRHAHDPWHCHRT